MRNRERKTPVAATVVAFVAGGMLAGSNGGQAFNDHNGARMPTGADLDHAHPSCPTNAPQCLLLPFNGDVLQVMPWPVFQNMTERQLMAIYTYLSAVPCLEGGPGEPPNRCQ